MKITTKLLALTAAATATTLLASCSATTGPSTGTHAISIAYGSITDADPLFRSVGTGLSSVAERSGAKVLKFDNKFDPTTALANTRLMIQQKPDIIMQWAPQAAAEGIGKLIQESGIPCIAINIPIPGCAFFNLSQERIGDEAGAVAADVAKKNGWTADDITVTLISISAGGADGHSAVSHFYSSFSSQFPAMKQAAPADITLSTTTIGDLDGVQVDSAGSLDSAYEAMKQALQVIPKERKIVVQTQNDDSARGALRALEQAKRLDSAIIASAGADNAAIEALRSNASWVAESDPSVREWPRYLVAMAKAVLDGVQPPTLTAVPQVTLHKENIDEYYNNTEPKLNAPLPAVDAYLEKYLKPSA